jgi:DNA modification methylase
MSVRIITGDCRERLREMEAGSVHTCVTSPPYFGLRDYGTAVWEGGWDPKCQHKKTVRDGGGRACIDCGAVCRDLQIGLEETPAAFVAQMVGVFREVRRVLRDDGTLWLNLGDSYSSGGRKTRDTDDKLTDRGMDIRPADGAKPKDLLGIPWRVAFALQENGWYLRQDIIWSKPNPMPESVRDRCTKAHEYLFLLSKGPRYYFDADAIAEPATGWNGSEFHTGKTAEHQLGRAQVRPKGNAKTFRGGGAYTQGQTFDNSSAAERDSHGNAPNETGLRNRRSVWTVATQPFKEAHFATYPPELIEPCILAGCPAGGTVLDPFGGAGTTGLVADRLQRNAVLIELNPAYADIAGRRLEGDAGMFSTVEAA